MAVTFTGGLFAAGRKTEKEKADSRSLIYGRETPFRIHYSVGGTSSHEIHFLWGKLHMTIALSTVFSLVPRI